MRKILLPRTSVWLLRDSFLHQPTLLLFSWIYPEAASVPCSLQRQPDTFWSHSANMIIKINIIIITTTIMMMTMMIIIIIIIIIMITELQTVGWHLDFAGHIMTFIKLEHASHYEHFWTSVSGVILDRHLLDILNFLATVKRWGFYQNPTLKIGFSVIWFDLRSPLLLNTKT